MRRICQKATKPYQGPFPQIIFVYQLTENEKHKVTIKDVGAEAEQEVEYYRDVNPSQYGCDQ